MKETKNGSPQSTNKNLIQQYKKASNTQQKSRRHLISIRIDGNILQEIEENHSNRSKAIRQALKEKYGRGEA